MNTQNFFTLTLGNGLSAKVCFDDEIILLKLPNSEHEHTIPLFEIGMLTDQLNFVNDIVQKKLDKQA